MISYQEILKNLTFSPFEDGSLRWHAVQISDGTMRLSVHLPQDDRRKEPIEMRFSLPVCGFHFLWHPTVGRDRRPHNVWEDTIPTMTSVSAPVFSLLNAQGESVFALALSETKKPLDWCLGVEEETAHFVCGIQFPADCFHQKGGWDLTVLLDTRSQPLPQALRTVRIFWEQECGKIPMEVPADAEESLYSTWYSYHQNVTAEKVEEECRRAAALGMKTVILDDGWQTGDGNRGYAFCGDWEVYTPKFPDMRAHVDRVHALGMKYIVWFSVPFVGKNSRVFARFRDKLLHFDEKFGAGVLDPRYPQVRGYLTGIYRDRMTQYGWDGLKLDFVDEFHEWEDTPPVSAQMDCPCIQDGVEKLMTEIRQAVVEVCPHAMIEFRQRYIGPDMRTFGNMFRVSDCPLDVLSNRVGIADLRMLSGDTAVHSDMLLWHPQETAENAARQIWQVLFGVVQISVPLASLSPRQEKMLRFLLQFRRENREILLKAPLHVQSPQSLYPVMWAMRKGRIIALCCEGSCAVRLPAEKSLCMVNASGEDTLLLRLENSGRYRAVFYDCCGEKTGEQVLTVRAGEVALLPVPVSGFAELQAQE